MGSDKGVGGRKRKRRKRSKRGRGSVVNDGRGINDDGGWMLGGAGWSDGDPTAWKMSKWHYYYYFFFIVALIDGVDIKVVMV